MTLIFTHIKRFACYILTIGILCGMGMAAGAQDKNPKTPDNAQEKIEALKKAYLTQQLDLNSKEAKKFWPLYNQYQKDMQNIIEERKQIQMDKAQLKQADNKQIEQNMNRDFQLQQQALQVRQKYRREFQNVLPPRKVMKVYRSEKDFNMKLIEELHRRQNTAPARNVRPTRNVPPARPRQHTPNVRPTRRPPQSTPPRRVNQPERRPASHSSRPVRSSRPNSR